MGLQFTKGQGTGNDFVLLMDKVGQLDLSEAEIRKSWEPKLSEYKLIRKKYLLYDDFGPINRKLNPIR